ncbi:hypothetical protein [Pelagicoccus sp. SDUM812002]|uniref:hypothetical protein n=1 Tax=Pelagicoccus sp. SDUM812002 TaxID=3041266 RepID=UPI00280EFF51|nr:hypothetical protein [Pelagicoccus sp. SDUM812002]MDQ8187339.1 hypothetical protein [Pelagicoccus sp. SDUM812002]
MKGKYLFVILLAGTAIASGQVADEGAADINPFATPAPQANADTVVENTAPTSLDRFQFNGLMVMNGNVRISLFDSKENKSFWIRQGQLGEYGISFQRFDEESETVVIAQAGMQKKLSLNKMKIEPLKIAPPRTPPVVPPAVGNVTRPTTSSSVETDEEARARIQRVAEEIRRRRAERRKQLEERNNGGAN